MNRLIIADDEVIISTQLEEFLRTKGFDIVGIATSGIQAVAMAKELMPDLMLMDIVMPGELDGIAAASKINRELKIPVICLAQLNRQAESGKEGHRPRLSHLRESGAIEQDADVVMFVHREEYYHTREEAQEQELVGKAELIVSKQRNGPVGTIELHWFDQHTRFENAAATPHDDFEPHAYEGTEVPFE